MILDSVIDPVTPAWFDLVFSIVPLVLVIIAITGLVSIIRRYRSMSVLESAGWTAVVVFAPVLGTLVWFGVGRGRYALE
ncbi:PLDc N-terminal domain-containing protein [Microcella humidisoli]|uniref:PLDc N-terminal domain-containing protein n=1 Tax=Microcella humidisoli TaxID=2963406 RepID=A0ABY5FWH5_9MICO|nr:PLDc N-terminal domain-containing protein [Microcella humidisoli]UTT62240.1 PLDc N-terminal domain-containing protein [Microcella humidisoli]